jgi:6,7-dimethyl-8-ribityllumazine synthase
VSGNEYDESVVGQPAMTQPPTTQPPTTQARADADEPSEDPGEATEVVPPPWPVRETVTPPPAQAEPESSAGVDETAQAGFDNGTAVAVGDEPVGETAAPGEAGAASEAVAPAEVEAPVEQEEADDDPFEAWPQPESGAVVEDEPAEGVSVEHVQGEIDVRDGYTVVEGMPVGHRRSVAVVVSRFNGGLTNRMLSRALDALEEAEVAPDAVTVVPVPGAFELPLAAMALAKTRRYACVIALGAIVRGETPHFDYVASEAASGLQLAAIETGVPVAFGVLTVETVEQGEARIDRAVDAVRSALEMADLFARLRATVH